MADYATTGFRLANAGSKSHWPDYTRNYLGTLLSCSREMLLEAAAQVELRDVPERVLEELARGGDGQFSDVSGQAHDAMAGSFSTILELGNALTRFEQTYEQALFDIDAGSEVMRSHLRSHGRVLLCKIGKVLAIAAVVVASVVSTVVSFGSAAAVIVALVAAAAATGAAVLDGIASWDSCNGNPRAAASAAERTYAGTLAALAKMKTVLDDAGAAARGLAIAGSRLDRCHSVRISRSRCASISLGAGPLVGDGPSPTAAFSSLRFQS
jgi:hypothetical protein